MRGFQTRTSSSASGAVRGAHARGRWAVSDAPSRQRDRVIWLLFTYDIAAVPEHVGDLIWICSLRVAALGRTARDPRGRAGSFLSGAGAASLFNLGGPRPAGHFERGPLQYALEMDWLAGAAGCPSPVSGDGDQVLIRIFCALRPPSGGASDKRGHRNSRRTTVDGVVSTQSAVGELYLSQTLESHVRRQFPETDVGFQCL